MVRKLVEGKEIPNSVSVAKTKQVRGKEQREEVDVQMQIHKDVVNTFILAHTTCILWHFSSSENNLVNTVNKHWLPIVNTVF